MKAASRILACGLLTCLAFLGGTGCERKAGAPSDGGAASGGAVATQKLTVQEVLDILGDKDAFNPGNFMDDEGMVRYRLFEVDCRGGYAPQERDTALLLGFMRDKRKGIDQRLCAASFLLTLCNPEAREFVKCQTDSEDGYAIFNTIIAVTYSGVNEWRTRLLADALDSLYPRVLAKIKEIRKPRPLEEVLSEGSGRTRYLQITEDGLAVSTSYPDSPSDRAWFDMECYFDEVCQSLGTPEAKAAVPSLVRFLEREPFRWGAAQALGLIGDRRAVPVLLKMLRDRDNNVAHCEHVRALGKLKAREAVAPLIDDLNELMTSGHRHDGTVYILALGEISDVRAANVLQRDAADPNAGPHARTTAKVVAARLLSVDISGELLGMLREEKDSSALAAAIHELGRLRERRAVKPLLELARTSPDGYLRGVSIGALGKIGGRQAVDGLVSLFSEDFADVTPWMKSHGPEQFYEVVEEALEHATGQQFGRDAEAWKAWLRESRAARPVP